VKAGCRVGQAHLTAPAACILSRLRPPKAPWACKKATGGKAGGEAGHCLGGCRDSNQLVVHQAGARREQGAQRQAGTSNAALHPSPRKAVVHAAAAAPLQLGRQAAAAEHCLVGMKVLIVGSGPLQAQMEPQCRQVVPVSEQASTQACCLACGLMLPLPTLPGSPQFHKTAITGLNRPQNVPCPSQ
jgi:hypothetical protein